MIAGRRYGNRGVAAPVTVWRRLLAGIVSLWLALLCFESLIWGNPMGLIGLLICLGIGGFAFASAGRVIYLKWSTTLWP